MVELLILLGAVVLIWSIHSMYSGSKKVSVHTKQTSESSVKNYNSADRQLQDALSEQLGQIFGIGYEDKEYESKNLHVACHSGYIMGVIIGAVYDLDASNRHIIDARVKDGSYDYRSIALILAGYSAATLYLINANIKQDKVITYVSSLTIPEREKDIILQSFKYSFTDFKDGRSAREHDVSHISRAQDWIVSAFIDDGMLKSVDTLLSLDIFRAVIHLLSTAELPYETSMVVDYFK